MMLEKLLNANNTQSQQSNQYFGITTGFVEELKDPAKIGRVKVMIPELFLEGNSETVSVAESADEARAHSSYARIATLMAGGGRGTYFIPEVGDEVVVAFEQGDMNRPVIIGVLWNKEDEPPVEMDGEGRNDIRAIHTRSGHKLIFDDSDDNPSIEIVDQTGNNHIRINSADNAMSIQVDGDLTIDAGGTITIRAGQDISIEAGANLSLTASGSGTVESGQQLGLTSNQAGVSVEGAINAEVKATMVSVNGSATTEIKGGLVRIN